MVQFHYTAENNVSRPASKKDVKEVVSKFNIQVDNLTQVFIDYRRTNSYIVRISSSV